MEQHQEAVSKISTAISGFYQRRVPFRLYHGSTNSTQARKVDPSRMVDTSLLNHVISVDRTKMTCLVEPNVPMDQLVDATMPHGFVPQVVMEFPGITVGGGFSGTAGESSGFKYGFFEDTVNWVEIVLGDGEIVRASREERSDLFWGAAGSFGTLGVTTLFELKLIPAKPYVELTYHPTSSAADALSTMQTACDDETNDYVDGIMFAEDHGAIVAGKLTDDRGHSFQRFSLAQNPWFYIHAERATKGHVESLVFTTPLRDYLFRYDRGAFWTGKYAFQYFITPFNRITRFILDYFMHTRVMYHALHASGHASKYMIQDLLLPSSTAEEFIHFVSKNFGFWPLWLCPFKIDRPLSLHPRIPESSKPAGETSSYVNIGVWGPGSTDYGRFVQQNRLLEQGVRKLGGIKWLYAQAYYTDDEFTEIYDRKWYEALREKYHATYMPTVSDKVRVDISKAAQPPATWSDWLRSTVWGVWPISGLYGVWKTLYQRDYLLAK
ncbi:hypothetical protein D0869_10725 [Hortaea werneckii]|uniref:Delta(24)-sterol reductase n=1 Tax=Hortaea werneckii TaxID=91943 RepID=A0A3M6YLZ1_HORWE|nr:hypothetical protein D0869_10725 [Hortaea werneckii]RMY03919.1 hypothetical protein D0868_07219 [Hortaea werneckii]